MNRFSISFVLPMYNERETIEDTAEEISIIARELTDDYEIIIADDASTDGSSKVIDRLVRKDPHIKVVYLPENTKFGGALIAGLRQATKDIIIYTDSDLPISLLDIKRSLPLIEKFDIVTATSIIKKGETVRRRFISRVYNFLVQSFFGLNIKDINSGYKIFRKGILEGIGLESHSPFVDVEIFIKAKERNAKIKEFPIIFRPRRQGVSKISRPSVIVQTFADMLRFKFTR